MCAPFPIGAYTVSLDGIVEERGAQACDARARKHSVQRRAIPVVGPYLHDIADVDEQRTGARLHQVPRAVAMHLQRGVAVLQQHRERPRIGVRMNAELSVRRQKLGIGARRFVADGVVVETQKARVPIAAGRIHRRRIAEVLPDRGRQASRKLLEGRIQLLDRRAKLRQVGRPLRAIAGELTVLDRRTDVEDLLPVAPVLRQLAIVVAPRVRRRALDPTLRRRRQREKTAHRVQRLVKARLGHAVPRHVKKTPLRTRAIDRTRHGARIVAQVDPGNRIRHRARS